MKTIFDYIAIGICVWNFIVFIMYAIDKRLAITHMNRISEKNIANQCYSIRKHWGHYGNDSFLS